MAKDFRVLKTSVRIACDVMLLNLPTSQVLICRMEMTEPQKLEDSIKDIKYRTYGWKLLRNKGYFYLIPRTLAVTKFSVCVCIRIVQLGRER